MIPNPAPQPVPPANQLGRHQGPTRPVRNPFLWCEEVKALSQEAFGTVILVHLTKDPDLWGPRKFGVIPQSAIISKSTDIPPNPPPHNMFLYGTHRIWQEYALLKRARDEGQEQVVAAIDQRKIFIPREASNRVIDDFTVVYAVIRGISFTMEYAAQRDIRHYI